MSDSTTAPPRVAGSILTYYHDQRPHTLHVGSPGWYRWLQTATTFTYSGDEATFTARRLRSGKGHRDGYWRAYRTHAGTVRRMDLGTADDLTRELLSAVAVRLAESNGDERQLRTPRRPVSPPSDDAVGTGAMETVQPSSSTFPPPLHIPRRSRAGGTGGECTAAASRRARAHLNWCWRCRQNAPGAGHRQRSSSPNFPAASAMSRSPRCEIATWSCQRLRRPKAYSPQVLGHRLGCCRRCCRTSHTCSCSIISNR